MNNKVWNEGIKRAKQVARLLRLSNQHRMELARICLEITDIEHGGRSSKSRYSIVKYGETIGINPNTVYEWVRVYRYLFIRLTPQQQEQFYEVSANMIKPIMKGVTVKSHKRTVRKKFDAIAKAGFVESKFKKYLAVMNTIIYHTQTLSKISEIPDDYLKRFKLQANRISKAMDDEIRARGIGVKRRRKVKREKTAEEIWLEAGIDDIGGNYE